MLRAVQLSNGADFDAGDREVDDEHRETVVLGRGGVCAGEQDAEVGAMGERRPDLLTVDQPAARDRNCAGLDAGEIGPRTRFGEQLAPDLASGQHARHVATSLRVGAELQQRRQAVAECDRQLLRHEREAAGLLPPGGLERGRQAVTPEGR